MSELHAAATPAQVWESIADVWSGLVARIDDEHWNVPTPCEEWTVADLVEHAQAWQARGAWIFGAQLSEQADFAEVRAALVDELSRPGALDGAARNFNEMPKAHVLALLVNDLSIHSWDLATALGVDVVLPSEAVEVATYAFKKFPDQMLRGSGMFGAPIELDANAGSQQRLIALSGRQPATPIGP